MKTPVWKAAGLVICLGALNGNASAELIVAEQDVATDPQTTEDAAGAARKVEGAAAVTPESLRQQLRSINTQRRTVTATETTGLIPQLPDDTPPGEDAGMSRLRRDSMHFLGGGVQFRYRNGEEGLDQLFESRVPMQFNFNTGFGRVDLAASTVFLTSGDLSKSQYVSRYYGANGLLAPDQRDSGSSDDQAGVEMSLGYSVGGFEVRVGTTPLAFEVSNETGSIRFDHGFSGGFNFGIGVSREPVKDSVLSYAGLVDPVSGEKWGGIMKNAANLGLGYDAGGFGVYIDGTAAIYEGENVDDNDFFQVNSGIYLHPYRSDKLQVTTGFNITYFEFDENLRFFTFGHGGYFSPESFYSASIPLRIAYTEGKMTVKVDLGLGMQYFSEAEAPFYPSDDELQSVLEVFETEQPVSFKSDSETQIATRGGAEVIFQVSEALSASGKLEFNRAADYEESLFLVGLEYRFGKGY